MATQSYQFTRVLHWTSACLVAGLLASGIYMADGHDYALYDWHKAFGVIALLLVLVRLYHRARHPWQSSAAGGRQEQLVQLMHRSLLLACVAMPLSGMAYSGLGGHGVAVFGLPLIPSQYSAEGTAIAFSQPGSELGKTIHYYVGYLMTALVLLHGLAALKHHFIDKDNTLLRMLMATEKTSSDRGIK